MHVPSLVSSVCELFLNRAIAFVFFCCLFYVKVGVPPADVYTWQCYSIPPHTCTVPHVWTWLNMYVHAPAVRRTGKRGSGAFQPKECRSELLPGRNHGTQWVKQRDTLFLFLFSRGVWGGSASRLLGARQQFSCCVGIRHEITLCFETCQFKRIMFIVRH